MQRSDESSLSVTVTVNTIGWSVSFLSVLGSGTFDGLRLVTSLPLLPAANAGKLSVLSMGNNWAMLESLIGWDDSG